MKIFAVVPGYNVAAQISEVVRSLKQAGYEVVVVDDGSRDRTADLALAAGATVLPHLINRGQGAALRTGTDWAVSQGAEAIVHFDGDGQFRVQDVAPALRLIESGEADIVFGSRFLDNNTRLPWSKRYIIHPLAKFVNWLLWGIKLTDPQSGFRVMSAEAAKSLGWRQDRMAHASEILALSHSGRWRVREVPITVIYHEYGQRFGGGLKILKELFIKKLSH
jgi:glycosyltransferase involved in cell wall biosynthesis